MIALDDNIEDHPKFVSLSDDSFSLWVRCIGYCRRNLTDGFIPEQAARSRVRGKRAPTKVIGELLAAPVGLPDSAPLWAVVAGGYQIHDYLDWNPSKVAVEAMREQKRLAGARGGKRSGEARVEAKDRAKPNQTPSRSEAECLASASSPGSPLPNPGSGSGSDPVRSDPDPISENSELLSQPGGRGGPPPQPASEVAKTILVGLRRHDVLQPIATMRLAQALEGLIGNRNQTLELALAGIDAAAFDAAEAGLNAEALSKKVRTYVVNERPKREDDRAASPTEPNPDLDALRQSAKRRLVLPQ